MIRYTYVFKRESKDPLIFEDGKLDFKALYAIAKDNGELELQSGKQELFENIVNQYI